MFILAIVPIIAGLLMILKPDTVWVFTESWKSDPATEPSRLFIFSIRFGGILCLLAGIGMGIVYLIQ